MNSVPDTTTWCVHRLRVEALFHERTIPNERPPHICEVSANFCRQSSSRGQLNEYPLTYSRLSRPEPLLFLPNNSSIELTRLSEHCSRPILRKSGSAGNWTWHLWSCSREISPLDHRGSPCVTYIYIYIYICICMCACVCVYGSYNTCLLKYSSLAD
jgi:hypothetical protein